MNKEQLWKVMKEPIIEKRCSNCVRDSNPCPLFTMKKCANYYDVNFTAAEGYDWEKISLTHWEWNRE